MRMKLTLTGAAAYRKCANVNESLFSPKSRARNVEAGRWKARTEDFQPAEHVMYSRARAHSATGAMKAILRCQGRRHRRVPARLCLDGTASRPDILDRSGRLGLDLMAHPHAMRTLRILY